MRRLSVPVAVLGAALVTAALAADETEPLRFGWPVPCKVRVTEAIEKLGQTATTRFTASLERTGDAGDLLLHLSDFEIVDLYGKKGDDPAVAAQVELTLLQLRVTPDLLLAPTGEVKDVLGLDKAVDTILDELAKSADETKKARLPQLKAQFSSPQAQTAMKDNAKKAWSVWVGEWIGRTIPSGRGADGAFTIACPDGSRTAAPTKLVRLPGDSEGEGLVRFTRESVLDGEDSRPVLDAWLAQVKAATGKVLPATGLRLVDRALSVSDPATLRPKRVLREEQRIVQMGRQGERVDLERHEYTFDWK